MKEVSDSFRYGMSLGLAPAVLGLPAASYADIAYSAYFRILHPAKAGETDRESLFRGCCGTEPPQPRKLNRNQVCAPN